MLPVATTTVTLKDRTVTDDPWDEAATESTAARSVPAHLSSPSGREIQRTGSQQVLDKVLTCEVVDLTHVQQVIDDSTGQPYEVVWVDQRKGLGLDHTVAGLRRAGSPV